MSKTERFLQNIINELKYSSGYDEYFSSTLDKNSAVVILHSGTKFKVSIEELEPTIAHDYEGKEMNREEFIEQWGDD